ncbi:thiamine pyrophosphate enzyme-like TPP bindin [Candidatus Koribacter versatilis Ellin345]|uniref:Thiamine pyrophosphate enzyme-like TPP bindin n=1 Tax=Koribacter versatilis (strain Ellin345) TaxID=204669 RepID=Q1IMQ6_KORVE|nr:thiamine pyrophosphate-binding protein [Candidatus Koribacter versatilis]ABF41844.1 thiamine pyrophosphate enzyme-like TPP bindin [Candidatus Koribacter versatilis Ellin345]
MSQPYVSETRNIASYAVDLVAALGSDTVFSLTGGMAMFMNRAVATHKRLKPVYCQHEQACVAAAEGYTKAADFRRAGFALITAGPGVSNSVTSLLSAYGDSAPVIVLAGQIKTDDIDRFGTRAHGIQEVPSQALITPCVKKFARVDPLNYRKQLVETLAEAFAGRPGPVFIEIPLDVQGAPIEYSVETIVADQAEIEKRIIASRDAQQSLARISDALGELLKAKRPLLYVGNGCRIAGVEEAARTLISRYDLPAVFSWLSFDILASQDKHWFGCPGGLAPIYSNEVLARADVILFLGARLDLGTTAFQRHAFGDQARRLFIDIDPAELAKFAGFPNTKCIEADLHALPIAVEQHATTNSAAGEGWLQWCIARRDQYLPEERERLQSTEMTVFGVAELLSRWSDGKVFVPASSGYAEETFSRFFAPGQGTRFFNGASLGSMGLGLAHSIGASFGSPRRVIGLEADGGLMLNVQELATLSHYAPKGHVLFVLNNGGYESIRASQSRYFGAVSGVDGETGLFIPDLAKIAEAFQLRYLRVDSLAALDELLPKLDPNDPPILVDLCVARFENRGPSVKTKIGEDGKPYTTPLAELSW